MRVWRRLSLETEEAATIPQILMRGDRLQRSGSIEWHWWGTRELLGRFVVTGWTDGRARGKGDECAWQLCTEVRQDGGSRLGVPCGIEREAGRRGEGCR
jgi:hypothetical protein